jgi:predicted dehydrogenase/sugar phosphate isomerase/epimerase
VKSIGGRLGIQSYCFRGFPTHSQVIQGLRRCEVAAVELCRVHANFGDSNSHRGIVEAYRQGGVDIVSIGVESLLGDRDKERPLFEFAKESGARFMSVHFEPESSPASWETATEMAEEYDLHLCVHNHGGRHWLGSKQMLSHLLSATSERIGLCLDTAWALDAGEDPLELAQHFATRLYGVHIKDFVFNRKGVPEDVVIGKGNLDLVALLDQLELNPKVGYVVIEYEGDVEDPIPALQECVRAVRAKKPAGSRSPITLPHAAEPVRVAIVGCGNVAAHYAKQCASYPSVSVLGYCDLQRERAAEFAAEYGGSIYPDLDDVLEDDDVEVVVNLTIHHAHPEVIRRALDAGKHLHTEKPLAMSYVEARELVRLAEQEGLRLSSAPITYMGEAQQTAWRLLRQGKTGTTRLVYAEVNHSRVETWHPTPEPFYDVGVLWDVGVYPLTLATAFFGPAALVTSQGRLLNPHRENLKGEPFTFETPDFNLALIDFASGMTMRLTANFYAKMSQQGGSLEFHGDEGTVTIGNFQGFGSEVMFGEFGKTLESVPLLREPYPGIEFGRGVEEMAIAIREQRPHRAAGAHAAHVVEIVEAIQTSQSTGESVELASTFVAPEPMDWAR